MAPINDRALGVGVVLGCVGVATLCGWIVARTPVGQDNTYAVHNYLTHSWNRSDVYRMEREITARFGGIYPMSILITATPDAGRVLEQKKVMTAIDELAAFLREQPDVGSVADVAYRLKMRNEFIHAEDPAYFQIPDDAGLGEGLSEMLNMEPGLYDLAIHVRL